MRDPLQDGAKYFPLCGKRFSDTENYGAPTTPVNTSSCRRQPVGALNRATVVVPTVHHIVTGHESGTGMRSFAPNHTTRCPLVGVYLEAQRIFGGSSQQLILRKVPC